jgi:cytoskeletal protein CcmA (bactofilin family)
VEPRSPPPRAPEPRAPEVRAPETAPKVSVLGPTLRFRGELSAQEDLIIQGSVEGSITHTQSLTVGTDGTMKGDIRARVIVIDGKVDGDLYATESVNIRATAKVKGNVFAPRVGITEGAFFQGQIEMQPSGAAVQEHSARLRQAAMTTTLEPAAVDHMLGTGSTST